MRSLHLSAVAFVISLTAVPADAAWHEARSSHFVIVADESPKALTAFATKLEKFDKAVRILRHMDDPPVGNSGRVSIYVLPNADEVSKMVVGKRSSIAGFYLARASGSVAFVPKRIGTGQEWEMDADTVFFHEYAHHLMFQNTDAATPPWLVEGFAEFFSTAQFERSGEVRFGMPAGHRVGGLYLAAKPQMETLLGAPLKELNGEAMDAFYGWAWLLTHYLTFDEQRHGQLARYIEAIQRGDDLIRAATKAFGDLKQLDRDTNRYLRANRFKFLAVNAPELNRISVAVRPLRAGEVAMMPARLRSTRGVNKKTAPEVAALMRRTAAAYPDDPAVHQALAEAEFDAGNYLAAEQAASRALALDPKSEKALIYKGRAQMHLAKSSAKADWTAIRANFLAANQLDKEDAEPLLLYYESFGRAGQQPTTNAIAGLDYALVLAPQDKSLRMMAVVQLIADDKLREAQEALAPLAFDPHSDENREQARKVLDALIAKDRKAALAALKISSDQP